MKGRTQGWRPPPGSVTTRVNVQAVTQSRASRHVLFIPEWRPTTLNTIMAGHWSNGHRRKKKDREVVEVAALEHSVPIAEGRRRVDVHCVFGKGERFPDKDAYWKSLLDSLVHAAILVEDSPAWCEPGKVSYSRGDGPGTFVVLTDL